MAEVKSLTRKRENITGLTTFLLLVGIATAAPLIKQQAITGPIVNATLFIAVIFLGTQNAILIGLLPSVIALSVGLLPLPLAPMIPFIVTGNAILSIVFGYFKEKNYWLGVVVGSLLKFLFLFFSSSIVINLILKKEIAQKVTVMMSWPQFLTALSGGIVAFLALKIIKRI